MSSTRGTIVDSTVLPGAASSTSSFWLENGAIFPVQSMAPTDSIASYAALKKESEAKNKVSASKV